MIKEERLQEFLGATKNAGDVKGVAVRLASALLLVSTSSKKLPVTSASLLCQECQGCVWRVGAMWVVPYSDRHMPGRCSVAITITPEKINSLHQAGRKSWNLW